MSIRCSIISKTGPLFRGVGDAALLVQQGFKTKQVCFSHFIDTKLLKAAVAVNELAAAPRADFNRTAQLMQLASGGLTGRAKVHVGLQGLVFREIFRVLRRFLEDGCISKAEKIEQIAVQPALAQAAVELNPFTGD